MSEPNGNGRNLTYRWLAGLLVLVLLGVGGSWAGRVNDKMDEISQVREQMARIEAKLDIILLREGK